MSEGARGNPNGENPEIQNPESEGFSILEFRFAQALSVAATASSEAGGFRVRARLPPSLSFGVTMDGGQAAAATDRPSCGGATHWIGQRSDDLLEAARRTDGNDPADRVVPAAPWGAEGHEGTRSLGGMGRRIPLIRQCCRSTGLVLNEGDGFGCRAIHHSLPKNRTNFHHAYPQVSPSFARTRRSSAAARAVRAVHDVERRCDPPCTVCG